MHVQLVSYEYELCRRAQGKGFKIALSRGQPLRVAGEQGCLPDVVESAEEHDYALQAYASTAMRWCTISAIEIKSSLSEITKEISKSQDDALVQLKSLLVRALTIKWSNQI